MGRVIAGRQGVDLLREWEKETFSGSLDQKLPRLKAPIRLPNPHPAKSENPQGLVELLTGPSEPEPCWGALWPSAGGGQLDVQGRTSVALSPKLNSGSAEARSGPGVTSEDVPEGPGAGGRKEAAWDRAETRSGSLLPVLAGLKSKGHNQADVRSSLHSWSKNSSHPAPECSFRLRHPPSTSRLHPPPNLEALAEGGLG